MASSTLISSPATTGDRSRDPHRTKKKKKPQLKNQQQREQEQSHVKWKSQAQQQIYSSKLRQALARVNLNGSGTGDAPRQGKAVREAAYRVLAVTARGRTRWSRAILTNRLKLKFRKQSKIQQRVVGPVRSKKPRFSVVRLKGKTLPAVQKKVRVLGRLLPGCRKEPLPVILEEAIDYIPALEMQVRAMTALADLLLGSSSSSSSSAAATTGCGSSSGFAPPS